MNDFRRQLTINLSVILSAFIVFGAIFYWFSGDLSSQADKIADSKNLFNQRTQLVESLAELKKNSQQIDAYKKAMDSLLPSKDELVNLPDYLDGLARAHNVNINFSFQGDAVQSSGQAGYIAFDMNVAGTYKNLEDFLNDIEEKSTKYLLSVDKFDLTRNGESYVAVLQGRAFFK